MWRTDRRTERRTDGQTSCHGIVRAKFSHLMLSLVEEGRQKTLQLKPKTALLIQHTNNETIHVTPQFNAYHIFTSTKLVAPLHETYSIAISLYCSYVANWITKITAEKMKPHNKTRQSRRRRRTQTSNCSKLFVQQPLVCSQQQLMLKVSFGQFVSSVSQNLTTQTKQSFCWSTGGQCSVVLLVVQLVSYTTYAYFLK